MNVVYEKDSILEDAAFSLCRLASTSSSSQISLSDESETAGAESPSKGGAEAKKSPPKRRPKQSERVSLEEMKRLMRVYGPTKCLRNRTPRGSGKTVAKAMSVKRKFFRWFPDFRQQFVLQEGGWYKPVRGHREEMQYRADSRRRDQEILVTKRVVSKRANSNSPKKMAGAIV